MIKALFTTGDTPPSAPKEGDLYKTVTIASRSFTLCYGYYEDFERQSADSEPIPIYPNFKKYPLYTDDGVPFITAMQDPCTRYIGAPDGDSCAECMYFQKCEELFGLCNCPENGQPPHGIHSIQNE